MNYAEKKKELEVKYAKEVDYISRGKQVDAGVAFNMLKSWAKGIEPCPFVNEEELKKDVAELVEVAEGGLKDEGND